MNFKPTDEQEAIVSAVLASSDNLIVSALAGAAKTSTLVLIAEALPTTPTLCLAFNKRIAVEMQERLPPNCVAKTLNSLGHSAWASFIGKPLKLSTSKNYDLLRAEIEKISGKHEKTEAFDALNDTLQAIEAGKTAGYVPTGKFSHAKGLMDDDEFFSWLDELPTSQQIDLIRKVTGESIAKGLQGTIDFSDQLLLPTVFPASFPNYPVTMVDEAQDLSALNHTMLRKIVSRKRLIAVGDECQSIYGFRGAHQDSMNLLRQTFSMKSLILSISFRCPQLVVKEAQWRAPHMRFPEWAKVGEVTHSADWNKATVEDGSAIICRNNAPLFSIAIKLLRHGRYPQLLGNDIGKYLIKVMKKFGPLGMTIAEVRTALGEWQEVKLKKARNSTKVHDQVACIEVFLTSADTLGGAIAYAERLFASQGPIQLMTGHKAKGLEFDNVYILDQHLIAKDDKQDQNLRYVMQTRAKSKLTYINSTTFEDEFNREKEDA